jgi:hypothetical protein
VYCVNVCRELKETGQKYGVCGTLCHIVRTKLSGSSSFLPGSQHQYTMRVASVGEARAVLCRRSGLISLSQTTQTVSVVASMPSCYKLYMSSVPIKSVCSVTFFFFSESKSQPTRVQCHVPTSHS